MIIRAKNENGIAIIMVLSTIALIIPVVLFFSLDSATNRLKASNIEERSKAKLTAESALKFAMARLKLYKEAYNFLQKNKAAKNVVKQEQLDVIWNFPFVYPIPIASSNNAIQKDAIKKFHEENVLDGSFNLSISSISNKINLNLLRVSLIAEANKAQNNNSSQQNNNTQKNDDFNPENQLIKALSNAIETESEKNELFNAKYYGIELIPLVNELKYFISDLNSLEDTAGAENAFLNEKIAPKVAPLTSFSELYTLPSWPDAIIDLIINEFTVHGAIMIDLNQMTDKLFKLLIPNTEPEDIEEFFKYKDNPEDPKYFNSLDDFKNYIVNIGNLMSEADFTERFNLYQQQGLKFGQTPTLFKIVAAATVGRSTYTITAYVTIPAKPSPRPKTSTDPNQKNNQKNNSKTNPSDPDNTNNPDDPNDPDNQNGQNNSNQSPNGTKPDENIIELLDPRVIEIIIS